MNRFYQVKTFEGATIKDLDMSSKTVSGYLSSFNDVDSDNDYFIKGSYAKTIKEWGPEGKGRTAHLLQHDPMSPIGKFQILKEDSIGLYFESQIPDTTKGVDTLKLYEAGIYKEHSVGFSTIKSKHTEKGNEISEVKLYEGSTVTWGANENTPYLGMKGLSQERSIDLIDRITKSLKNGTFTDETFGMLEIALEQIKSYIHSLEQGKPDPKPSTSSLSEPDFKKMIQSFSNQFEIS